MIYLSKGIVQEGSTEQLLHVLHCGQKYELAGTEAAMWINGRYAFAKVRNSKEQLAVNRLQSLGLVESEYENDSISKYRIASRCVFCPAATKRLAAVRDQDATIVYWLKHAGIRLTVAELVYLFERNVEPTKDLLYTDNRQRLVERIYTKDTIADNLLETQMESAECRDEIIEGLLRLLKKKQILAL